MKYETKIIRYKLDAGSYNTCIILETFEKNLILIYLLSLF